MPRSLPHFAAANGGSDERRRPESPQDEPRGRTIRIVLADDHALVLQGVRQLLAKEPDMEVIAACSTVGECVAELRTGRADILLLDLSMPDGGGLAVLRQLGTTVRGLRVIIFTGQLSDEELIEAIAFGVRGVLLKDMPPRLITACIRKVHGGGTWIEKESLGRAMQRLVQRESAEQAVRKLLSTRELEVMRLMIGGMTNTAIAEQLCVSLSTVKSHAHAVYEKLGVDTRVQLTLWAKERGLL